jgi:hypothetical protein
MKLDELLNELNVELNEKKKGEKNYVGLNKTGKPGKTKGKRSKIDPKSVEDYTADKTTPFKHK